MFIITVTFILSVIMMMFFIAFTGMGKVQYQKLNDRAVGTITDDTGAVAADGLSSEDWIMDYRDELTVDLSVKDMFKGGF